jgi:serine/threonine-protein phosphatase 2A regulatory subunit B''
MRNPAPSLAVQQQPPVFNREEIPQFYFPHFKHATHQITELQMTALLKAQPDVLGLNDVKTLLKEAFNLPSALAYPLLCKLSPGTESGFSKATLVDWLRQNSFAGKQDAAQAFDILRQEGCTWVSQQDLRPLLAGIVVSHPGLEFLHDSPEFQER